MQPRLGLCMNRSTCCIDASSANLELLELAKFHPGEVTPRTKLPAEPHSTFQTPSSRRYAPLRFKNQIIPSPNAAWEELVDHLRYLIVASPGRNRPLLRTLDAHPSRRPSLSAPLHLSVALALFAPLGGLKTGVYSDRSQ